MDTWAKIFKPIIFSGLTFIYLTGCGGSPINDPYGSTGAGDGTESGSEIAVIIGNGSGDSFEAGVMAATEKTVQAGGTTELNISLVDENGEPVTQSTTVEFSSECALNNEAVFSFNSVTTSTGLAYTTYTATGCVGTDVVTATATIDDQEIYASVNLSVSADTVTGIQFSSLSTPTLALPGTGGITQAEVTFKVVGELGGSVAGEEVSFSLSSSLGGLSIPPGRETSVSDENGFVSTVVESGTVSTSFQVNATHISTDTTAESEDILVSTGVPVDGKFSVALSTYFPADAYNTDNIVVDVSIIASDFLGNDVPDNTRVYFASPESGNIDESCTLISGQCTVEWTSAGDRPNDLRATIIAYTSGAEDFTDGDANSVFNGGGQDSFNIELMDITEPYIDENDNGQYDVGEFYADTNTNDVWDLGNGLWDGPCLNEINASADCSGETSVLIYETRIIRMTVNTPRLIAAEASYDNGASYSDIQQNESLEVDASDSNQILISAIVGDANTLADQFGGHPLPVGAEIKWELETINGSEYSLTADTKTVNEGDRQPSVVSARLIDKSDTEIGSALLHLKVSLNGENTTLATYNITF